MLNRVKHLTALHRGSGRCFASLNMTMFQPLTPASCYLEEYPMTEQRLGPKLAEGKTKIIYAHPDDPALAIMLHKDSISAGDGARRNTIAGKGALSGRRSEEHTSE